MKKTLIALLSIGSVATYADSTSVTLNTGVAYTASSGEDVLLSALDEDGTDKADSFGDAIGFNFGYWPNNGSDSGSRVLPQLQFTVTISDLYNASALDDAQSITLDSFAYIGNSRGYCEDEGRRITVSVDGTDLSKTVRLEDIGENISNTGAPGCCWFTVDGLGFDVTKNSTLTITLLPAEGVESTSFSMAVGDIYAKNNSGITDLRWAGVTNIDLNNNWSNEAPFVKLGLTVTPAPKEDSVPEPATAALSLLALAGLVSRRRRK